MSWQSVLAGIPKNVEVLVASKSKSAKVLEPFLKEQGFPKLLGENYAQELEEKLKALKDFSIRWHFIGALQSKKIKTLVSQVSCIESVAKEKHLDELLKHNLPEDFEFLLQVNTSGELSKSGFSKEEIPEIVEKLKTSKLNGHWKGLMCLPSPLEVVGEAQLRKEFALLRKLRDQHLPGGVLSMGTSTDFKIAIEEGATRVRLGSILLGSR